jgi:predicted ATPase
MPQLNRLTVRGFKSIRALEDFELGGLNALIGANGAGKSNFICLFRMLAELSEKRLQLFVQDQDGPDSLLFGTRKRTPQMDAEFYFARNGYRISLKPSGERLIFAREETWFSGDFTDKPPPLGSRARRGAAARGTGRYVCSLRQASHRRLARLPLPRYEHFGDRSPSSGGTGTICG